MVLKLKPERDEEEAARALRMGLCPHFGTKKDGWERILGVF